MRWPVNNPWMILLATCFFIPAALAVDSDINITGRVVAAPCTLTNDSLEVNLGKIKAAAMHDAGSVSNAVPFSLLLENCPASTTRVGVKFDGQKADDETLYKNSGDAENADVEVRGAFSGMVLGPGSSADPVTVDAERKARFDLTARIKSTAGNATPGKVSATALVTFTYQ